LQESHGYLGVIDHTSGTGATSHLNVFTYNAFGELTASGNPLDLGVSDATGVAIMKHRKTKIRFIASGEAVAPAKCLAQEVVGRRISCLLESCYKFR
jgi:hypothetical protein